MYCQHMSCLWAGAMLMNRRTGAHFSHCKIWVIEVDSLFFVHLIHLQLDMKGKESVYWKHWTRNRSTMLYSTFSQAVDHHKHCRKSTQQIMNLYHRISEWWQAKQMDHIVINRIWWWLGVNNKDNDQKDKDPFIGPQEFVVGYSMAPEQPQSSARHTCRSHAMTSTWHEKTTICITAYIGYRCTTHCTTGDDIGEYVAIKYINRCNAMNWALVMCQQAFIKHSCVAFSTSLY